MRRKRDCFGIDLPAFGRRKRCQPLAMTVVSFLLTTFAFGEVYITTEEAIGNIFPNFKEYVEEAKIIDNREVKVYTVLADARIIGWAAVLDEMGKVKPITFLVGIDSQGKVLDVYILEYRDMFGSEIKRRSFLRQFRGRSATDQLKVGRDIDAVTGATISSNAAAAAVRKALTMVGELNK